MAGRKPKPTAVKKLEGNPGKRKLNKKEPLPAKGMTNKIGSNMRLCYERNNCYCYGKYIYFMNYGYSVKYYIYRQEIGNPANLQKIDIEVRQSQPTFARNGRIYYEEASSYSGSYCCYIIDTDKFTMKEPETYNIYDANDRQYVPVIGYPLTYYLTCGSNNAMRSIEDAIANMGVGSTFKAINKDQVYKLSIPIADMQIQNRFVDIAEQSDKSKFELQDAIDNLDALSKKIIAENLIAAGKE